jgi:hypothetical protein
MNLGIYGCSYTDTSFGHPAYLTPKGWPNLLSINHNVTNYGKGGSSIYYSYNNFIKNHHKHEQNIFCITSPYRWHSPVVLDKTEYFVNALSTIEHRKYEFIKQNILTESVQKKLDALYLYYTELQNDVYDQNMSDLMLDRIKILRPDTIMIEWDYLQQLQSLFYSSLDQISNPRYTIERALALGEKNCICHLSEEINAILAAEVEKSLKTGIFSPKWPDLVFHPNPLEFYYNVTG